MNERIRELWRECVLKHTNDPMNWQMAADEFAELIVGHAIECVRDVLRDENSDLSYVAASQVQKRLREHFGVEE
jgi:hypothetical protein